MDRARILDDIGERTRWAYAIIMLIAQNDDSDDDVKESADCAARQLLEVRKLIKGLWEPED